MDTFFQDIWLQLQSYYTQIVVLLPKVILAAIIFAFFYTLANRSRKFVNVRLTQRMDDPLLAAFLSRVVKIVLVITAFLIALQILGLAGMAAGIVTGASVSAIVIGFAFKDIGENFLAGIMLAFNRPFQVGDTVELNGHKGQVVSLNLRNSRIKTFDGKDIFIPNANVVKNPVVNYTMDGFLRFDFKVGLDYDSNVNQAVDIILNVMQQIPGILQTEKKPNVFVSDLGSSSMELTIHYWLDTFDKSVSSLKVKTQAIDEVLTALNDAGFYIPGDVIEMKNFKGKDLTTKSNSDSKEMKVA
ncbi:MAG: mechanosensitive ion channel family protein [Bacteroidota bacterium]